MQKSAIRKYVFAAMFAALIFVFTVFAVMAIPGTGGYVHLGDAVIYLAASILPFPFALFSAAIGAAFADLYVGFALYAPATFLIKPLMAACFTAKREKLLCRRNAVALGAAGLINIVGYYLTEAVITGSLLVPAASVFYNFLQSAGSALLFLLFAFALDRVSIKKQLGKLL